jgi:hypothetical protein
VSILCLFFQQPSPSANVDVVEASFKALAVVGAILASLGAMIGFFLTRYWNTRDHAAEKLERVRASSEAERTNVRNILYESLKWFEGGTQRRSIGIAVVKTSWKAFEEFRALWLEVLVNQSIYLLTASKQERKPHEHENLRRMMELIVREKSILDVESLKTLCSTLEEKLASHTQSGLTMTPELKTRLADWQTQLNCSNTPSNSNAA